MGQTTHGRTETRGRRSDLDSPVTRSLLLPRSGMMTNLCKKVGITSDRVKLRPLSRRKERARRGKGKQRTRKEPRLPRHLTAPWTRLCLISVAMAVVKEAILVVVDQGEGPDHLEDRVGQERLDRLEDQVEEDPEGHRGRLEADRLEDLVGRSSRLRPRTTPTRMVCSTLHKRLGIWPRSKEWHSKWTMSEGI